MTVYVLVGASEYGEADVLGVYESRDGAIEAKDEYVSRCEADTECSMFGYDFYEIYPYAMGAVATSNSQREVL